jgi:hypothetical protein
MSARERPRQLLSLFGLPILRVSRPLFLRLGGIVNTISLSTDANLFKDAFLKAQKENEELFDKANAASEPAEVAEPSG